MKHTIIIIVTVAILVAGTFLPFVHGDYDYFSVGLSFILQFAVFTSLLLVPVGLIWYFLNLKNAGSAQQRNYPRYLSNIVLVISIIIMLAAALGAFASHNRFSAIAIFGTGIFLFMIRKKIKIPAIPNNIIPYYLIIIPLAVAGIRFAYFKKAKARSTLFVIKQSEVLINDIEAYRKINGHYPVSLHSTIEDYHTGVSGIPRFHYELKGDAYNLFFAQTSDMLGTEEIVMYNKLDEHEMTVHNQDLLRIPYNSIFHGHHKVVQLPNQHWKIFYFD